MLCYVIGLGHYRSTNCCDPVYCRSPDCRDPLLIHRLPSCILLLIFCLYSHNLWVLLSVNLLLPFHHLLKCLDRTHLKLVNFTKVKAVPVLSMQLVRSLVPDISQWVS